MAEFTIHLRDQVDLDALENDIVTTVAETLNPRHVTIWLNPESTGTGR